MGKEKRKLSKGKRWLIALLVFVLFVTAALGVLQAGSVYTETHWTHYYPEYAQTDISALLNKSQLSAQDYDKLYRQTGLTKVGIDDMRKTEGGKQRILQIQEAFFADYTVNSRLFAPFTYMDEVNRQSKLCDLKDGDIIVSATTRISWWRYGHAAIVVDGRGRKIAEAIGPGSKSELANADVFTVLANYIVLRPKVSEEVKTQIAEEVKTEMLGIPYRFTAGLLNKKYTKKLKGTQCAHFVWYAYKKYGVELDSNGGKLVKPQDIALSDNVEVVQAFGFDLEALWS